MFVTNSAATWRLGTSAVVLAFVLDPLGDVFNVIALAVILLAACQAATNKAGAYRNNGILLALSAVIVLIAALEVLHPNVPSLAVGLLGFRKTATVLLGLMIGLGWRGSPNYGLRLTWWCMFITACISLSVHLIAPSIEQSIGRSADKYTAELGGVERMQGLLAGPFHVSMLGVFLVLSALAPRVVITQRWVRASAATVGLFCIYFAQVRTGLVALAVGIVVMMLATGSARKWANRLLATAVLVLVSVVFFKPITDYASQFTALRLILDGGLEDARFTGRFTTWSAGFSMLERSPLYGNGSGSAGDTLGQYFNIGNHVTSHNTFLKYAVEGGLFQGLLFAVLCISIGVAVRPKRDNTRFGVAAASTFIVFAMVGAAPESLPVSFGLATILGLCAQRKQYELQGDVTHLVRNEHISTLSRQGRRGLTRTGTRV